MKIEEERKDYSIMQVSAEAKGLASGYIIQRYIRIPLEKNDKYYMNYAL